jgi:hypothetical protein
MVDDERRPYWPPFSCQSKPQSIAVIASGQSQQTAPATAKTARILIAIAAPPYSHPTVRLARGNKVRCFEASASLLRRFQPSHHPRVLPKFDIVFANKLASGFDCLCVVSAFEINT